MLPNSIDIASKQVDAEPIHPSIANKVDWPVFGPKPDSSSAGFFQQDIEWLIFKLNTGGKVVMWEEQNQFIIYMI